MSWLYSIVLAGLMFSSDGAPPPVYTNSDYTESNTKKVVKSDETERFEQTYSLNANGRVSVSNVNGSITIDTWDNPQVKLEAVKTADDKEKLSEAEIKIDAKPDYFRVETDYGNWTRDKDGRGWRNNGRLQVEYRLTVPRGAVLNEIETVNGSISIANATNMVKASAVNGEVRATNLRGATNLSTVNGTVEADFDQLQNSGRISLETVNGTVNLTIPSDANATVRAESLNGAILNDFGLPVKKGEYVGRDLYGRIGSGDAQIRLNSVNGSLSIKRKADGKNPNPAVNLLGQKSDDADAEEDMESSIKDAAKSRKDAQKAIKDAQKEIKKIKPELEKLKPEIEKAITDSIAQSAINVAPAIINGAGSAVTEAITDEVKAQVKQAMIKQREAQAKLAEINWNFGAPVIEKKSESFAVRGTPKVTVDAKNCAVSIRGWDKPEVSYSLVKISRNSRKQQNGSSAVSVKNTDSEVSIKVSEEAAPEGVISNAAAAANVRLEIYVPKKSNLKIFANREIRLEGVSGEIDLQGEDEAINVRDADGKLSVGTVDGRIRVIGFRGAFDGRTENGMMNLEGDFQSFNALASGGGTIVLTLPENAAAVLESNAEIENDGLDLTRDSEKTKLWRVGSGGAVYRMNVQEGKVVVRSSGSLKAN